MYSDLNLLAFVYVKESCIRQFVHRRPVFPGHPPSKPLRMSGLEPLMTQDFANLAHLAPSTIHGHQPTLLSRCGSVERPDQSFLVRLPFRLHCHRSFFMPPLISPLLPLFFLLITDRPILQFHDTPPPHESFSCSYAFSSTNHMCSLFSGHLYLQRSPARYV